MSSESSESISLSYKADLVYKRLLLNNGVKNFIISQLVGTGVEQRYRPHSAEWADPKGSQILYVSDDVQALPPVVIKIQHIVDEDFLHSTVRYCEKVNRECGAVPIILIFTLNRIQDDIMGMTTRDLKHPFLLKVSSFPWANKCMFLTEDSMRNHLTQKPLSPLVALGSFLISQKVSILSHSQKEDPTVQFLYRVSKDVMMTDNTVTHDLLTLCDALETKLVETGLKELEKAANNNPNKRAIDCLNESLEIIKSYKLKYRPRRDDELTSTPVPSSSSSRLLVQIKRPSTISPEPLPTSGSSSSMSSKNWEFVDNYQRNLGEDERMDWKDCFAEGKSQGFFSNYSQSASLKNAYQRFNRRRRET